ncbi:hypothetical protein [Streptomyces griseosporeus]|uniref:hypothetical protein n=1 Tax=Streptomyces griseosporeus TaxID=1910 RepID=UPI00167DC1AA|nr:hypothetical protein [Streptomyces griseosporeus]GHF92415.1 hypothetical protein GCM10018783_74160 [Streptomyces griseosporeus]
MSDETNTTNIDKLNEGINCACNPNEGVVCTFHYDLDKHIIEAALSVKDVHSNE